MSLYHYLHVIQPIRLFFNYVAQRLWLVKVKIGPHHQFICIRVKPTTCARFWHVAFFLEQAFGRSNETRERFFSQLAIAFLMN